MHATLVESRHFSLAATSMYAQHWLMPPGRASQPPPEHEPQDAGQHANAAPSVAAWCEASSSKRMPCWQEPVSAAALVVVGVGRSLGSAGEARPRSFNSAAPVIS